MSTNSRRVLVIEDEHDIARLLAMHLEDLGCQVDTSYDGRSGLARALDGTAWSLLVLDLRLPGLDGLEICRRVRSSTTYTPILMLTARASELDRVLGLEIGADDYLAKPFSIVEFAARVKAILRRVEQLARQSPVQARRLRAGDLEIDLDRRIAKREGQVLELTVKEFDLLLHLMQHPARVFTRAHLLDQVWGTTHDTFEHTVNSHINRLRAKLEPHPTRPRYIVTVWGVGYRFCATEQEIATS
ncbi:MAG TPA: response regulator transcription factor [Steroidobacteraceae bacterium]|nr:response regulator transcription factor [Steroidobacteraceae bacterium]